MLIPMKSIRLLLAAFAACLLTASALASDPSGTWKWTVSTPNGDIDTTLKLVRKEGVLTGTYSNSYGDSAISHAACKGDTIAFEVVRDIGGSSFVLHYRGKLDGDAIKGTIEIPGQDGGDSRSIDWNAKRVAKS